MDRFISANEYKRHVMIVDDEEINRLMLGNILENEYEVVYANNGQEAWDLLNGDEKDISLLLLDLLMPVMDGFELITKLKEDDELKRIPVIVMTSEKEAEVKSIKLGASDFITKPYDMPEVILARCERIIKLSEETRLIRSTEKDAVTGLFTRDYFFEYIRQIEAHFKNTIDALVFNIDHFHLVNEMYGRNTGDSILMRVAEALEEVLRPNAIISCRTEADTFYVYCAHIEDYAPLVAKIQEKLGAPESVKLLRDMGFSDEIVNRVSYLVGHHHTYTGIDGIDYQILVEADFLVNIYEDNMDLQARENAFGNIFRTSTGKRLFRQMYPIE